MLEGGGVRFVPGSLGGGGRGLLVFGRLDN